MKTSKSERTQWSNENLKMILIIKKLTGKEIKKLYSIPTYSAQEILEVWNYKTEGLKVEDARNLLQETFNEIKKLHASKIKVQGNIKVIWAKEAWKAKDKKDKYLTLLEEKQQRVASFAKRVEKAHRITEVSKFTFGVYYARFQDFFIDKQTIATVKWNEQTDWNYYAKSYGKPKNTYSNRRVEFIQTDKLGHEKIVYVHCLDTFRGDFLINAIVAYKNLQTVKVAKHLKKVQLNEYFDIRLDKKIGGIEIYYRLFAGGVIDFCIYDTKTKETYHNEDESKLVEGLRKKINAKIYIELEIITKETGKALGFCEAGMRNFCNDNDLDYEGSYTRKDLRNIVLKQRSLNCQKYNSELAKVGINLNCK